MSSLVATGNHAVHSFLLVCVYVCAHMSEFLSSACHFLGLNRAGSGVTGRKEQHLHGGLFTHTQHTHTRDQDSHVCLCIHWIGRSPFSSACPAFAGYLCLKWDVLKHCPLLFAFRTAERICWTRAVLNGSGKLQYQYY